MNTHYSFHALATNQRARTHTQKKRVLCAGNRTPRPRNERAQQLCQSMKLQQSIPCIEHTQSMDWGTHMIILSTGSRLLVRKEWLSPMLVAPYAVSVPHIA
eukprot:988544-Rhodomonas_salina.1